MDQATDPALPETAAPAKWSATVPVPLPPPWRSSRSGRAPWTSTTSALSTGTTCPSWLTSGVVGQCASTGCLEDLNQRCPAELRTEGGGACRSACDAFNTPEYCCKGEYGSPSTCKPSMYSQLFKNACPKSYSYAYDDATSTFTCAAADYVITFCPSLPSQKSSKPDDATADGSGSGSVPESGSSSEPGSGSGSVQEAILADGSWLADLATGDSSRTHFGATAKALAVMIPIVHLARLVVP
ncbi:UNVERIFIED_CONTAM: Thaumatin-like protein 1 [Sesamum radiatum]|uniref:Thaumatin-like protein 1 n=1 Tax=Sesamum radiatum TaxID=300843 RepID=A0AAW2VPT6_SESRA